MRRSGWRLIAIGAGMCAAGVLLGYLNYQVLIRYTASLRVSGQPFSPTMYVIGDGTQVLAVAACVVGFGLILFGLFRAATGRWLS